MAPFANLLPKTISTFLSSIFSKANTIYEGLCCPSASITAITSPDAHKQPSLIALDKPDLPNLLIKRTRLSNRPYSLTNFAVPS